jgi:hypothetical protein
LNFKATWLPLGAQSTAPIDVPYQVTSQFAFENFPPPSACFLITNRKLKGAMDGGNKSREYAFVC